MKKRIFALLAAVLLLCTSCTANTAGGTEEKRYSAQFLTLFDTVTAIVGYAASEEEFSTVAQAFHDELEEYHQLFDIYETYDGIANLKTVNDMAGKAPVKVDRKIIDLLLFCREVYEATSGGVDVTMGSVLALWHEARNAGINDPENAALPEKNALLEAKTHTGFDLLVIDEEASTVFLTDPKARLDVGAVAKGYAVERASAVLPEGVLVSVGGNVLANGGNPTTGNGWVVGVQDPDGDADDYLHTLYVDDFSVVTSGDYQRYFTVDGASYHHIIDPETLFPAAHYRAVTVLHEDSGMADALSTAVFLLPLEEGKALLREHGGEAVWVDHEGELYYSEGFSAYIRS